MGNYNLVVSYAGSYKESISDEIIEFIKVIPWEEFYVSSMGRYFTIFNFETEEEAIRKEYKLLKMMIYGNELKNNYISNIMTNDEFFQATKEEEVNKDVIIETIDFDNSRTND